MEHKRQEQPWMQGHEPQTPREPPVPLVQGTEMLQCILTPGVWFVFWMACQQLPPGVIQASGMGGSPAQ